MDLTILRVSHISGCCCSVAQSCPTFCNPLDCSTPVFSLHYLLEFTQTHVHWVCDAIQPSHPLSPLSSPALSLSQHFPVHWLFTSGRQSIGASGSALVLPMNIQDWYKYIYIYIYIYIYGIIQYLSSCVWLTSHSIKSSRSIHVVAYIRIPLFFKAR